MCIVLLTCSIKVYFESTAGVPGSVLPAAAPECCCARGEPSPSFRGILRSAEDVLHVAGEYQVIYLRNLQNVNLASALEITLMYDVKYFK